MKGLLLSGLVRLRRRFRKRRPRRQRPHKFGRFVIAEDVRIGDWKLFEGPQEQPSTFDEERITKPDVRC